MLVSDLEGTGEVRNVRFGGKKKKKKQLAWNVFLFCSFVCW